MRRWNIRKPGLLKILSNSIHVGRSGTIFGSKVESNSTIQCLLAFSSTKPFNLVMLEDLEQADPTEYQKCLSSEGVIPNRNMQELKDVLEKTNKTVIHNTVRSIIFYTSKTTGL